MAAAAQHSTTRALRGSRHVGALAVAGLLAGLVAFAGTADVLASYAYQTAVLAAAPAAYLPADSHGASFGDLAGSNGCAVSGGGSTAFTTPGFVPGSAEEFRGDGVHACKTTTPSLPTGATAITFEFWGAAGGPGPQHLLTFYGLTSYPGVAKFEVFWDGGAWQFHDLRWGDAERQYSCGITAAAHMFDWVISGTTGKVYVDGVLCVTDVGSGSYGVSSWCSMVLMGRGPTASGDQNFCGSGSVDSLGDGQKFVGQVAVYGRAETGSAIASRYAGRLSGPAAQFIIVASPGAVKINQIWTYQAKATDSSGTDVSSSTTFTTVKAWTNLGSAGGVMLCDGHAITTGAVGTFVTQSWTWSSTSITCSVNHAGTYALEVSASTVSDVAATSVVVGAPPGSFSIVPNSSSTAAIGQVVGYHGLSQDLNYRDVSATDSWVWTSVPSGVTCRVPVLGGNPLAGSGLTYSTSCAATVAGQYQMIGTDSYGYTSTAYLDVNVVVTSAACGNDIAAIGCWLQQVWNAVVALAGIPQAILAGIYDVFLVSKTGRSYVDFTSVTAALIPTAACRSGQAPTAPDGVRCLAFPFSVPGDLGTIINVANVSPTAPTFSTSWTIAGQAHTVAFNPASVLTTGIMDYVRGAELLLLIVGTAFGTWRWVEMAGVGG